MSDLPKDKDVTHLIERLEALEELAGIRFDALFAALVGVLDQRVVRIYGEIHPQTGSTITCNMDIMVDVYDTEGKILTHWSNYIRADRFWGFATFKVHCAARSPILNLAKIRVYPKLSRSLRYTDLL